MKTIPDQAICGRCAKLFVYFRRNKHRVYCRPCIEPLKDENNRFYNHWAKVRRHEARRNAREAHATA